MNFHFPIVSFFKKTLTAFMALSVSVFSAGTLFAAPLAVVTEAGAEAVFKPNSEGASPVSLGVADADGILIVPEAPAVAGTLIFTHADAASPAVVDFDPAKNSGKISVPLKLRAASLIIAAQPADEVEIFVDGKHCGRGAVTLGNVAPRKPLTVEARSARRGVQSRVVSAAPGEMVSIKFDLRGNSTSARPDGQVVLPELPLVLASQAGATVRADGVLAEFDREAGALRGLEPGSRVVEIFLPWQGREVCVWRAVLPVRSAMLPGADVVGVPVPVPADAANSNANTEKASAEPVPVAETDLDAAIEPGRVLFSSGTRVTVSLGSDNGAKVGPAKVAFGDAKPISVDFLVVTPTQSILQLAEGSSVPADDAPCRIVVE